MREETNTQEWWIGALLFVCFVLWVLLSVPSCARAQTVDLSIIATIESSNNPAAYNKHSGAVGLYQITPICIKDYNQTVAFVDYTVEDMYKPVFAEIVARWYLYYRIPQMIRSLGHEVTLENILSSYNCGVGCVGKPLPKETRDYIAKYKRLARGQG